MPSNKCMACICCSILYSTLAASKTTSIYVYRMYIYSISDTENSTNGTHGCRGRVQKRFSVLFSLTEWLYIQHTYIYIHWHRFFEKRCFNALFCLFGPSWMLLLLPLTFVRSKIFILRYVYHFALAQPFRLCDVTHNFHMNRISLRPSLLDVHLCMLWMSGAYFYRPPEHHDTMWG